MLVIAIAIAALYISSEAKIFHEISPHAARPFYYKVSGRAYRKYIAIATMENTPIKVMRKKSLEWAKKHGVKAEMEKFYKEQAEESEKREKKIIALLENAAKAYRKYLTLFDDNKTARQIAQDEQKLHNERPKEYYLFKYVDQMLELL
ncbi:hypothetical protein Y032_0160g3326 [Ancylostoma ceylanicum]|nr:hypothetical protein Y032_0160g3326 [Ancylostoma ceylanicum]